MSIVVDFTSPNEKIRRNKIVAVTKQANIEAAKKAQIESQIHARKRAQKRKEMTEKRAKRKRINADSSEEPEHKKKKNEGRIIDFTERDYEHVKRIFNTVIIYFGNLHIAGLVCGYDLSFCPTIVYPVFISPGSRKDPVYSRKFILGVGKSSNVFTGIRQAFTELYPEYPADRVYDWKLMKWNKKAYRAVTAHVAVDPSVLSQRILSSKSFGGAKPLPEVKVTDEIGSVRKMECAIEVSRYINEFVPQKVKDDFPKDYRTWSISDIYATLDAVNEREIKEKEKETEVALTVNSADIVKEAFDKLERQKIDTEETDSESEEYSNESE